MILTECEPYTSTFSHILILFSSWQHCKVGSFALSTLQEGDWAWERWGNLFKVIPWKWQNQNLAPGWSNFQIYAFGAPPSCLSVIVTIELLRLFLYLTHMLYYRNNTLHSLGHNLYWIHSKIPLKRVRLWSQIFKDRNNFYWNWFVQFFYNVT